MDFKEQPYFRYDPLDQSKDSFRLCKLLPGEYQTPVECELVHNQISAQSDLYHGLSYTWGKPEGSRWIRLNGKPFHIQQNLFAALKAIRKADTELVVWADAICIDQRTVSERNHQVSQMGNIYRNAKEVLAWMGPAADDSDMLVDYARRHFGSPKDRKSDDKPLEIPSASDEDRRRASRALSVFNKRDYWQRAWIIQEIILAKE
ncbi:HET-domain-containing protein, partial [Acephala macrosclerotiorum]